MFKNWSFFQAQTGAKYGYEKHLGETGRDGEGSFFLDLETVNVNQADNILYSRQIPFVRGGLLRIKFDYKVTPRVKYPWIRLGWSVGVYSGSVADFPIQWLTDQFPPNFNFPLDEEVINDIYVTNYNTWQTFELIGRSGYGGADYSEGGYVQIKFYMHNHYGRDFDDITDLKTYDIEGQAFTAGKIGKKVMVDGTGVTYLYVSETSTDAESLPDIVHPNTYGGENILWRLEKTIAGGAGTGLVSKFNIDNVKLDFFFLEHTNSVPTNPPDNITYQEDVSLFVTQNLTKNVVLGDMIIFDDSHIPVIYNNEQGIYVGHYRLSDSTPTHLWTRDGVAEAKRILQITLEDYRDQFSTARKKLSGVLITDTLIHYVNAIHDAHSDIRLQHTDFEFDCKNGQFNVNLVEVLTGEGGEPPVSVGAFENDAFTAGFEIG
jgi:hypothetical protein